MRSYWLDRSHDAAFRLQHMRRLLANYTTPGWIGGWYVRWASHVEEIAPGATSILYDPRTESIVDKHTFGRDIPPASPQWHTFLHHALEQHPDIFVPGTKELLYFDGANHYSPQTEGLFPAVL
jgi:hypothetical protein